MSVWRLNGAPIGESCPDDRGFAYGDGLFETVAVRRGRLRLWQAHAERLELGAMRLGIAMPGRDLLEDWVGEQIRSARCESGVAKLIVTRGRGPRGYRPARSGASAVWSVVLPQAGPLPTEPMHLAWSRHRLARQTRLAGMKHLNRLDQVLASGPAAGAAFDDWLLLDTNSRLICATMANVFLSHDSTLVTPAITHAGVAGVMRRAVLEAASVCGIDVIVDEVGVRQCLGADGVFLSNSQYGIRRVATVDARPLAREDRVFDALRAALAAAGIDECAA